MGSLRDEGDQLDYCQRRVEKEFWDAYYNASTRFTVENEEVELTEFKWRELPMGWQKYLQSDWDDNARRFGNSTIGKRLEEAKTQVSGEQSRQSTGQSSANVTCTALPRHEISRESLQQSQAQLSIGAKDEY